MYADTDYYNDTYIGRTCTDDDILEKWLSRASDDIDVVTLGTVDITELSTGALEYLKKATCAQTEYYVINGDEEDSAESFSLGAFSIKESTDKGSEGGVLCNRALRYLVLAGLGHRRVCVR